MESDSQPSRQTKPKLFCFVLMPFSSDFDDVYQIGIKEACEAAGAYCERVDEQIYAERMLDRIYNQIAKADLIIADMTGKNANVFYEVGYAHALGKPTVLLTRNAADIPFDLTQFPHIVYESKISMLREQITKRVAWHIEHPSANLGDTLFPFEVHINGTNSSLSNTIVRPLQNKTVPLNVVVGNKSIAHFSEADFKLVLVTSNQFNCMIWRGEEMPMVRLPDGKQQFSLPSFGGLMSTEYNNVSVRLYNNTTGRTLRFPDEMSLRLLSVVGNRDYSILAEQDPSNQS